MFALATLLSACATAPPQSSAANESGIGQVTEYDPALRRIIAADARIEQLASGFRWAEGPVWLQARQALLFTDVPENSLYRWTQNQGVSLLLKPSGYSGPQQHTLREAGANGLYGESGDTVLLADSGSRSIARLDLRSMRKTELATHYQGSRFNSPNDLVRRSDGVVFFTDPTFGLEGMNQSPVRELDFNGVYRLDVDGKVTLLDDTLSFPNGIALSPDERVLYVSNADAQRPIWMAYTLDDAGQVLSKRQFADGSDLLGKGVPGLPDGMAIAADGTLFASAPGGVLVLSAQGKRLGRIETGMAISNCTLGEGGRMLYLTSDSILARVPVRPPGR